MTLYVLIHCMYLVTRKNIRLYIPKRGNGPLSMLFTGNVDRLYVSISGKCPKVDALELKKRSKHLT